MVNICAIITCYNRKEKTKNCIQSLVMNNVEINFSFVIVDDNSTDGTFELLNEMKKDYNIHLIRGNGSLYYSGGMRKGMKYVKANCDTGYKYILLINDDVLFFSESIPQLIEQSIQQHSAIVVGATCDNENQITYGAIKYIKGFRYNLLSINEWNLCADTFNANCVLIPRRAFEDIDVIDKHYLHSLGDFDYGLSLRKAGYKIYSSKFFVGICEPNSEEGTWLDKTLPPGERIKKKECVKGAPIKQWFYFLKKNFGIISAFRGCLTPYIRILIRK